MIYRKKVLFWSRVHNDRTEAVGGHGGRREVWEGLLTIESFENPIRKPITTTVALS